MKNVINLREKPLETIGFPEKIVQTMHNGNTKNDKKWS